MVITSLSSAIDWCATFKKESGNWGIDWAAWGSPPLLVLQLVGLAAAAATAALDTKTGVLGGRLLDVYSVSAWDLTCRSQI